MRRFRPLIIYIPLVLIFVALIYVFYLVLEPFKPPTITTPIPILNKDKTIRHGEAISTRVDYCVFKKVPVTSTRRYEESGGNSRRVFFLSTTVSEGAEPGCATVENNTSLVPNDIPPGKYKIILDSTFEVNPLKSVTKRYETEEFTVAE